MTKRNEKSTDSHESLTLRRVRERFNRNRLDFNHLREASQDQNKESQNRDDNEKSIEMQRQESSQEQDQREKRVKIFEEFVQFV